LLSSTQPCRVSTLCYFDGRTVSFGDKQRVVSVKADFFISRAGADAGAARIIADLIREAGATAYYEDDFGHADFMRCMEQGYESGCNDYVTKPVNSAELLSKIRSILGAAK